MELDFLMAGINKMTEQEKQSWAELCLYVKKEILDYDDNMKFPKHLALRLKGLHMGQFIANKNIKVQANYSFDIILKTFKEYKNTILNAIRQKNFKTEQNKINYILAIIERNINDVYLNEQKKNKAESQISIDDFSIFMNIPNNLFLHKNTETKNQKTFDALVKELW